MKPRYAIPIIFSAVGIVYLVMTTMEEATKERADPYLLFALGLLFTACALITLRFTESWTLRSAGILLTIAGDAVLYSFTGGRHFIYFQPETLHHLLDLARSCFYVGAPTLVVGLLIWLYQRYQGRQSRHYTHGPLDTGSEAKP